MTTNKQIKQLYDSFEKKDMSFPEFVKSYKRLMDPTTIQADFARICRQRHNKKAIDRAIENGRVS